MSEPKQYMLMEVVGYMSEPKQYGDGPKFAGKFDAWLSPWSSFGDDLKGLLLEINESAIIRFTFLEMTDAEHAVYCEEHGVEWK